MSTKRPFVTKEQLEAIVRQMEQGNVSLQESLKLFEEGSKLARQCGSLLDEAELKVVRLMKNQGASWEK